jgi:uncharacterized protein (DUF488 family)
MTSGVDNIGGKSMTTLYTIGYGGRHPQHFVTLLTQANIALVCDVRAEPRRAYGGIYTFNPETGSGPLPRLLAHAGIAYAWFPELGNPERQDPEIRAFQQLMDRDAESRLQRLQTCVHTLRACLLCAEQDAQRCHRRIITAYLTDYGYDVQHL